MLLFSPYHHFPSCCCSTAVLQVSLNFTALRVYYCNFYVVQIPLVYLLRHVSQSDCESFALAVATKALNGWPDFFSLLFYYTTDHLFVIIGALHFNFLVRLFIKNVITTSVPYVLLLPLLLPRGIYTDSTRTIIPKGITCIQYFLLLLLLLSLLISTPQSIHDYKGFFCTT